jgi:hypothetical protein
MDVPYTSLKIPFEYRNKSEINDKGINTPNLMQSKSIVMRLKDEMNDIPLPLSSSFREWFITSIHVDSCIVRA